MDNEMIERVAKAIFTKRYEADGTYKNLKWEDYKGKEFYLDDAMTAIKAMREPTEKMVATGADVDFHDEYRIGETIAKDVYQTMIDAVISDD